jgi:hypothetical protein
MTDRFVLFLDVLGFSQLVSNNSPDELRKIYDTEFHKTAAATVAFAGPMFGRMPNVRIRVQGNVLHDVEQDGLNFHVMSDTLIAWTNDNTLEALVHLAQFTAAYLSMTLTLGVPHRGAISKGNIQLIELPLNGRSQANVVGTGVVNAHNFEPGQEWMGCVVDPECLEGFETSYRNDFPVVEYKVPYGEKPKRTSTMAIDWPRCLVQLQPNADMEFFRNQFGRYNKPVEAAEKKIMNTATFFAAMKEPRSTAT